MKDDLQYKRDGSGQSKPYNLCQSSSEGYGFLGAQNEM